MTMAQPSALLGLPDDLLATVLGALAPPDLGRAAQCCRRLAAIGMSNGLWHRLCLALNLSTEPKAWLQASLQLHGPDASAHASCAGSVRAAPTSYRGLYRLLRTLQPMIGYWRGMGDAPRGSLFKVSWGQDCLELHQLQCSDDNKTLRMCLLLRVGPLHPLHVAELVGDTHLVVRQFRGEHRTPCAAATAAAAVCAGGPLLPRLSRRASNGSSGSGGHGWGAGASAAAILVREDVHPSAALPGSRLVGPTTSTGSGSTSGGAVAVSVSQAVRAGPAGRQAVLGTAGGIALQYSPAPSPPAPDFNTEVLRYMASQVAPPRGQMRRRQRAEARSAASSHSSLGSVEQGQDSATAPGALQGPAAVQPAQPPVQPGPSGNQSPVAGASSGPPGTPGAGDLPAVVVTGGRLLLSPGPGGAASHMLAPSPGGHTPISLEKAMSGSSDPVALELLQQLLPPAAGSSSSPPPPASSEQALVPMFGAAGDGLGRVAVAGGSPVRTSQQPLMPVGPAAQTHHFVRLQHTPPTRAHPMAGLWKGVYGPHGLEIISASYDFSGAQARVCAWKVTGDHNVPAGQETWWASAAPQSQPWSEHELHLQEARLWLSDLAPAQPVWLGGPLPAGGPGQGPGAAAGAAAGSVATAAGVPPENRPQLPRILSSHIGCGRIAGLHYSNPQWVPGRLWVLENGNISFLYMWPGSEEEPMFMVDYTRVV